jgi:hypothetical protein
MFSVNQVASIEDIFKSRLEDNLTRNSSSLLRGDAFNLHLRGWSYDPGQLLIQFIEHGSILVMFNIASLIDRRNTKYNVSFDLTASCVENCSPQTSNISRTMKLGRIDSVPYRGMSSSIKQEHDDESSTISFHVSTKYIYTLTFSSVITINRGRRDYHCSMSTYDRTLSIDCVVF